MQNTHDLLVGTLSIGIPSITVILQLLSDIWFESQDPCFDWKRFDFKVFLWGRKVTSRTFNKRVPG